MGKKELAEDRAKDIRSLTIKVQGGPAKMWMKLIVARNGIEAEMLKGILNQEGDCSHVEARVPHLGSSSSVEILVPASEAEEANEILQGNLVPLIGSDNLVRRTKIVCTIGPAVKVWRGAATVGCRHGCSSASIFPTVTMLFISALIL